MLYLILEKALLQQVSLESKGGVKKLVTVSAISTPVTVARKKAVEDGKNPRSNLAQITCIYYLINFGKKSGVKLVGKKKFAEAVLDLEHETYVVHVRSVSFDVLPSSSPLDVYPFQKPQISSLITKEAPIKIRTKYLGFADVFSSNLASELLKHIGINNHAIKLVDSQQSPYGAIYSLKPVELELMKAYIETNLANEFIRLFKSLASAPILFDQKLDGFFQLYVNY